MLTVILTILKILGLVIAGILGLILLILGIVLFVPIRYQIKAVKTAEDENNIDVKAKVTYLLHLVNVHVEYPAEELYKVRIGLIQILPKKVKPDKQEKTNKKKNKVNKPQNQGKVVNAVESENKASELIENAVEAEKKASESVENDVIDDAIDIAETVTEEITDELLDDNPTIHKFFTKVFDIIRNIKETIENTYNKISDILTNIEYYLNILTSIHFDRALDHTKRKIAKMLYSMRPRTVKGYLNFGSVEPDTTAMVYGLYTAAHPFIFKDFVLNPIFEENVLDGNVLIKGKITIINILIAGIKIYFNKDVKYLIKKFTKKHKEKENG